MASTPLKTPTQKRQVPGQRNTADSSSAEVFTPVFDDSNWSEVICSKADQYAKLIAAQKMNNHYKAKIEKLKREIENLNRQGESTLSLLENIKQDLISQNEYFLNVLQSYPPTELMEQQILILKNIKEKYTLKITDDKPFRDLGILKKSDDLSKLPKRLKQLLSKITKQKSAPFITSYSGVSFYDSSMKESSLRRRYHVLKQTTEGSIRKAESERDNMKNEITELKERIQNLKAYQSFRRSKKITLD
ncbi:hypothetical protein M9Y10_029318 [Tritrichomonas musculus]|uniref:Uncharacterized protein n=1 Tax=Tritrichomonas musculus TaxID=1915356 RepID=A0ABR2KMP0_9EUKA